MPRLSIVLALHREQAYVEQLARSVLGQPGADVELLAIDDASPDHGPALLDELAAADPRVRVHHLAERAGPGAARDLGLELAGGDYVWFVNATDVVEPGALAEIDARVREHEPDVLLLGHTTCDALGATSPGPHARLLAGLAEAGPATLERRPAIAGAAPDAFDKVLRREHLRGLGVRFGPGGSGELPVVWPALLTARSIAAAPGPAVVRRPRGNEVPAGPPADVFAAYDAVFAWLDERGDVPDARRRLIVPSMVRHELRLLPTLPAGERRAFFARMSAAVRRHRRGDEPAPSGRAARLRHRLVERNGYAGLRVLERALAERRRLRQRRGRAAARARRVAMRRYYRTRLRRPIDPDLAVFAAYWYRGYSCNPRAIYEKARELVPGMRGVWVVDRAEVGAIPPGVEHVVAGTREYFDLIARARTFVNNVNFPNHLVKRPGTVHVMTHHGTPLKWMGLDLEDTPVTGRKMDFAGLLRRSQRWDYSISSNTLSTLVWERVFPTRHETLEVGYPRNDVLANATPDDVARIRAELGIEPGQVAILYTPTHREWLSGPLLTFDLARLAEALGPDHVVLARLHYFYGEDPVLRRLHREGRVRDVAAHPSVEELCLAADVLLTDYSSIMFDYAVLDRPIVVHAPDWEVYRAMRGTYFDLMAEPPGVVTRTDDELLEALRTRSPWSDDAARLRSAFRARFCTLDDGGAAERVVRRLWPVEQEAAAPQVAAAAR